MGHGRGQPDRLPLARPLARSPTRGEQGTRQVGRGHGTRATREDRPPVQPPPAWLPHPPPPRPHPLKRGGGAGGGRQKGTQTGGGTGKHEPAGTGTGGRGGARQGKAHNDDQAERPHRPGGTHAPRRGGQAQEEEGGRRGSNEKKNPAVAPRPPGAPPASPSLPPRNLTRVCGQDAPRPTGGWKPGAQPPGATPKPRGLGGTRHRAATARGEARGGGRTPRRPAGHHRGTHPRGAATRATRPRGGPPAPTGRGVVWGGRGARKEPQAARRTAAGSRPDTAATAAAALGARGKREAAAARTRPPDRYRAGSQPRGAGTRPDAPTPPPAKHTMPKRPLAARGGSQRDGGGQGQRPRREPSGPSLPSHGRRAPPQGLAAAAAHPQPTHPTVPHALRQASGRRGQGVGGGGGCGADTAGGRGGAPVSALRGTKGTRRPCEDTPAAPPPERETPRGWRLIVKRRSDRRSPGRNPGPQVRSKCR